ncbi:MAG: tol-pal system-associated acyl-CoA thioesterase [Cellvibrionales bacterium]|nr:tol-pal system-associated acyl-CoA thioesterase [Cellvibrionales bacterium]
MKSSLTFSLPVRVYIEDTDAGGIVFYPNYLKFMERARTEMLRSLGFGKKTVLDQGALLVVHHVDALYKRSAYLDDELTAHANIIEVKRASFTFDQSIYRGDELLVDANIKIACVDREKQRPVALPKALYESIAV